MLRDTDTTCEALELLGRLARRNDLREAEALFERARVVAQRDERAVRVVLRWGNGDLALEVAYFLTRFHIWINIGS